MSQDKLKLEILKKWEPSTLLDDISLFSDKKELATLFDNQKLYNDRYLEENADVTLQRIIRSNIIWIKRWFKECNFKEWVNFGSSLGPVGIVEYNSIFDTPKSFEIAVGTRNWQGFYPLKSYAGVEEEGWIYNERWDCLVKEGFQDVTNSQMGIDMEHEISSRLVNSFVEEIDYEVITDICNNAETTITTPDLEVGVIKLDGAIQRKTVGKYRADWLILSKKWAYQLENLDYYQTQEKQHSTLGVLNDRIDVYIMNKDFDYALLGPYKSNNYFIGFYIPFVFMEGGRFSKRYYKKLLTKDHYAKLVFEE